MCGIVGIISLHPIRYSQLKKMNESLIHRGPDGEGYSICGKAVEDDYLKNLTRLNHQEKVNVGLSHRRLAIQDLTEAGFQPMHFADRYVITYNGEVYNFPELRKELEQEGYQFQTRTDTEIILAAYDFWKDKCLEKFNGMWAFILYDKRTHEIFVARDRLGVKPLYYYHNRESLILASEIKALLKHSEVQTIPDGSYLRQYLNVGAVEYGKQTAFEGINRFPKASYIKIELAKMIPKRLRFVRFWKLKNEYYDELYNDQKASDYAKKYYDLLKDSVRIRLRADVKIGTALSGGLDSSSIVWLINDILNEHGDNPNKKQITFSSVYKMKGTEYWDESEHINKIIDLLNIKTFKIEPKVENFIHAHKKMIFAMDSPPDGTSMSSWFTYEMISKTDVGIMLDGEGGDEQLAGYRQYLIPFFYNFKGDIEREKQYFQYMPGANYYIDKGILINRLSRIIPQAVLCICLRILRKRIYREMKPLNAVLLRDINGSLETLCHYLDRVSMFHSKEARTPFLDYRLVEFLHTVPACYKIHEGWTKYIARRAFDIKLPKEINWNRDKRGWSTPEKLWVQGKLKSYYIDTVSKSDILREIVGIKDIRRTITDLHEMGKLIRYLNLAVWHRTFFPSQG